jgi:parallel beta-helix repeat protein
VDAANSGDTVYVFSGIYNENINISKALNLDGEDRNTTIINGNSVKYIGNIVQITADWVNITGFKITNSGNWFCTGILLKYAQNCEITKNDINLNNSFRGISTYYSFNNTINNNIIHNTRYGIVIWRSSYITVRENDILNNDNGIRSHRSSHNNFLNNIIHNERNLSSGGFGFYFAGIPFHDNKIIGNKVYNNYEGIKLIDHYRPDNVYFWNNSIISNIVYNNSGGGISILGEGINNYIIDNIVYASGRLGTENKSGRGGIHLSSPQNNSIIGNTLHNNAYGIYVRADLTITPKNNIISDNNFHHNNYGIYCNLHLDYPPTKNNTISTNIFHHNDYGIYLDYFNENNIVGNILESNTLYGIWLSRSRNNTIYHNKIINNTNQVIDDNPANNYWHHPDLLEGNFWSDYTGLDNGNGTGKHAIAYDGIGDTLIPHPDTHYDFYPLTEDSIPPIIPIIDIDPDTLNLKSKGRWITCYIDLPDYDVSEIDISSILLEDTLPAEWGDIQGDTLMVKFDRSEMEDLLSPGSYKLKVTGELTDGMTFEGNSDEIRVIDPP